MTPRKIIKILEKFGFIFIRQKGSHCLYGKENFLVVIPYHNKDLKPKTMKHILKQAGLEVEEFIKLL
ncbi:type II toxin-antitoxin system HicA family toxin [Candidatus Azambacteria bacterium]|nr:type II toxin-antitoxin system HicA family toxin [Candidatus Azambacteria bacterium]